MRCWHKIPSGVGFGTNLTEYLLVTKSHLLQKINKFFSVAIEYVKIEV